MTSRRRFPTIRASCEFPGSSVVERRTVNPLVGGSNPSRGAKFHKNYLHRTELPLARRHLFEPPTDKQARFDNFAAGEVERPQGDPEGARREAPSNPSRGAKFHKITYTAPRFP